MPEMKKRHNILRASVAAATVSLIGLSGCSSMKVEADWSPEARFTALQSYAWMARPPEQVEDTRRARREAERRARLERHLIAAVDRELAAKGYTKVSDDPDFLMAYFAVGQAGAHDEGSHHVAPG